MQPLTYCQVHYKYAKLWAHISELRRSKKPIDPKLLPARATNV